MKRILALLSVLFLCANLNAQSKVDTLNNEKIVLLTKIGLQPEVIVNKIQTSVTRFDVSTDGLIELSKNGIAPEVINAMMKSESKNQSNIETQESYKNPSVMHTSGIYYYNPNDANEPLKKIQVVRVNSYKSSTAYAGYGGSSEHAVLSGVASMQQISVQNPVFYFYFNRKNNTKEDWYENAASPNEFALVRVEVIPKKIIRQFKVGGTTPGIGIISGSTSSGIPEKEKLPFHMAQISEGIFKVTFNQPLTEGEYCFVFSTETDKVFDFGIHLK